MKPGRGRGPASRGLTLIELMAGLAVALAVLTAALGLLHQMAQVRRRQEAREQLGSTAGWLLGTLGRELRQAGLGRPKSTRAEGTHELFPPTFLIAEATRVAFVADLPRPDSSFNGFSTFSADPLPTLDSLSLLNELNGGCDVGAALAFCDSSETSHLFKGSGDNCVTAPATSRTCPWGLGRYRDDEYLLVVSGAGRWVERQLASPKHHGVGIGVGQALHITTNMPAGLVDEAGVSRAWVSTPDRVFYRLTAGGELQRMQCWGSVGATATLSGAGSLTDDCDPANPATGTGWETLARNLAPNALQLTYRDAAGNVLTPPVAAALLPRVRRVEVTLRLQQSVAGATLDHVDTLTVAPRP
jgi:type II secretory pathway pseudopilin PulG